MKDSQLSQQIIACKFKNISNNINYQLTQNLNNCHYFSLVLYWSCNIKDTAPIVFGYILNFKDLPNSQENIVNS